ncbi:FMN-binding protein [Streptomyces sp. HUAS TT7]|uniref:FMN-binding protein n=1 Tax=Streptomyces sp. HUAS TT7 TaxID=3447507 RepID=UPI003F65BA1A
MRRVAVTTLSTAAGVVLLLSLKPHQSHPPAVSAPRPTTSTPATAATGPRTGDFTGDAIDTRYGPVQVSVTLDKGRLTAVHVLQVPSESGRDQEIAARSVPRLNEEALGAQNARIDAVSGASYTSEGYIQSLQSALDKAGE